MNRTRRRYRFPSRIQAEAEYERAETERIDQIRLARALYADKIRWTANRPPYRLGLFDADRPLGPRVAIVFESVRCVQEPTLCVVDAAEGLDRWNAGIDNSEEGRALAECISDIRAMLREGGVA